MKLSRDIFRFDDEDTAQFAKEVVYELNGVYYKPKSKEELDYHAKQDYGKAKLSLLPTRIFFDIARVREYGNAKYPDGGSDNWKSVEAERYWDAAFRHLLACIDDHHSYDSESGLPHLWHLACNIAFLCEMEDLYLSEDPEVVERLKKEFWTPVKGEEEEPTPPRDWSSAQTDE